MAHHRPLGSPRRRDQANSSSSHVPPRHCLTPRANAAGQSPLGLAVLPPPRLVAVSGSSRTPNSYHCQPGRGRSVTNVTAAAAAAAVRLRPPVLDSQNRARTVSPLNSRSTGELSCVAPALPSQVPRGQARTPSPILSRSCSRPALAMVCSVPVVVPDVPCAPACSQSCFCQDLVSSARVGSANAIRYKDATARLSQTMRFRSRSSGTMQSFAAASQLSRAESLRESVLETARVFFSAEALEARVNMSRADNEEARTAPWSEKYYSAPRTSTASTESSPSPELSLVEEAEVSDTETQHEESFNSLQVESSPLQTSFVVEKEVVPLDPKLLSNLDDPRIQAMLQATTPSPHKAAGQEEPNWDDVLQYCRGLGGSTLRRIGVPQGGVRSLGLM